MAQDYKDYAVPDLWKMVAEEDPESGFVHVNTLNRQRVALEQQRDNLRTHRDRLIEGWSPERSEAAASFIARINGMIDVMTSAAGAVGRICTGIDAVYAAIREARREIVPLVAEYKRQGPVVDMATTNASKEMLNQRARSALIAADAKVADASGLIDTGLPTLSYIDDVGSPLPQSESGSGGSGSATSDRTRAGSSQAVMLRSPVFNPPAASTGGTAGGGAIGSVAGSHDAGGGLVLMGGPTGQATTSPGESAGVHPVQSPTGLIGGSGGTGRPMARSTDVSAFGPIGVGPGAVIGAPASSNLPGGRFGAARIAERGPGAGSSQAARGRRSAGPPAAPTSKRPWASDGTGGYRDRSFEEYAERRRSKRGGDDELWPVEEGVSPILEPPPASEHDPGPGVLGLDR